MRLIRGLGAFAVLLALVVGVPVALTMLGGNPWPSSISWSALKRALFQPDDGTLLIGLITVVGWMAWLVFAVSVMAEIIRVASGRRIRVKLPGLAGPQRLAAGLVVSVVAILAASPSTQAEPAEAVPAVVPVEPLPVDHAAPTTTVVAEDHDAEHIHEVKPGDDLWSLAQHYYGHGRQWRKIALANPARLTGGPDRLQPGWRLSIPDVNDRKAAPDERSVRVRRGDTLSSIAKEAYGAESDWPRVWQANRSQLSDPDELLPGMRLVLPEDEPKITPAVHEDRRVARQQQADQEQQPPASPPAEPIPHTEASPVPAPAEVDEHGSVALGLASAGSLLAAGLIAGVALRRRAQLQMRPVGRRIMSLPDSARRAEIVLGSRQRPLNLRTLDLATRAISAHCRRGQCPLPPLQLARVGDEQIELSFASAATAPPPGFQASGSTWLLDRDDRVRLRTVPGIDEALRPYPGLVSIGRESSGQQVLVDLEGIGLLALDGDPCVTTAVLAAMAIELAFSPSADELILTMVGGLPELPGAIGKHNVSETDDLDAVLERLERRAHAQRAVGPEAVRGQHRIDPDLADSWSPEIVLINLVPSAEQVSRLTSVLTGSPPVSMAAVVASPLDAAPWRLDLSAADGSQRATLEPLGLDLVPQLIEPSGQHAVVELITATGTEETTSAPWWRDSQQRPSGRSAGWTSGGTDGDKPMGQMDIAAAAHGTSHPMLQLLGPIELLNAAGSVPPRAGKQCLEYCAWLLENPRTTAMAMTAALAVAEGTRRSNMSRLRAWLGSDSQGEAYLPDAYTGRIVLHPAVSSDWQRFQILASPAINRSSTPALRSALGLVRGAPLADAAPGQWHWAEELRTDMISAIRDCGVELTNRALDDHDLDLARWAASRALAAAPGDELLMAARIRTEHQAGNTAETERLTLQVAAQARSLGLDLDPETVILLQEVMEGQVRARMA
jgi:nucleoid-associated protein YgaU